jgi:hypothetical protein
MHLWLFLVGIYLRSNPQEKAGIKGLLGIDRLSACWPEEMHPKFGSVPRAFWPVEGGSWRQDRAQERSYALLLLAGMQM